MNWYGFTSLIVGYLLAAMFSSFVSLNLTLTVWASIWTYIVIAFWWLVALFITWLVPVVLFGGIMVALAGILGALVWVLEGFETRRRTRKYRR